MFFTFLILLGLSLPAMAINSPALKQSNKGEPAASQEEDVVEESMHLCNPKEETRMPQTFY